jgi:amidase
MKMFALSKYTLVAGMYIWDQHPTIYGKAMNNYRRLQDAYDEALSMVDVFITPTTPYIANRRPPEDAGPMEQLAMATGVEVNTACFNASGHPAMSLPIGMLPSKETKEDESDIMLPVGMQIVGKWFDEEMVYRVGAAWEAAHDWKKR